MRQEQTVCFESGCPQQLPDPDNRYAHDFSYDMVTGRWLDTARGSIFLNWDPTYDIEWQSYDWGDPVRCLMCASKHRRNPDQPHDHYRWTRPELADLVRTRSSWTVVILPPVVVHAAAETGAGLFGLLTDARVQLVNADDEARSTASSH
ncbi:hypothetical protein diail_7519 [Diaporthe ilicicola]|nr:hypothetical protein diail_7519 [Diaporthe ilicicola]